jgi:hypothetical protein
MMNTLLQIALMTSSVHSYQMMVDKQSEQLKVIGRISS